MTSRAALIGLSLLAACSYRPVRFGMQPVALGVADDKPIPVPRKHDVIEELYDADVYVRREIVKALDPRRAASALDVNAFDEVAASSWLRAPGPPLDGYGPDGPPVPPVTAEKDAPATGTPGARLFRDSRGLLYEILPDIRGRAGMRTSSAAVASRLLYALGYRTAEVHVAFTPEGDRFAATRWPAGVDLGPTPMDGLRDDDPNDLVEHRDRRSLRALKLVTAWLDLERLPPRMLRDAYVGERGKGHVQHFLVGLDGALGVDRWRDAVQWMRDQDREDSNFFLRLFSFGLSPKPSAFPPETNWSSVGVLPEFVVVDDFSPSPPFEPIDRMQPADAYWIAKRIAGLTHDTVAEAVAASKLDLPVQHWLFQILHRRRAQVVAWGYDRVTPLEVGALLAEDHEQKLPARLVMVDLAIRSQMMTPERSSYRARFLDGRGDEIAGAATARAAGERVVVTLPPVLKQSEYVVVQILGLRGDRELPRPVEVHLRPAKDGFSLAGVRH